MNKFKTRLPILLFIMGSSIARAENGEPDKTALRLMTYNIRFDTEKDGAFQWTNRAEALIKEIKDYHPDIVGVQEALHHQLMQIMAALPDYNYIGVGRDDGQESGEYSAIIYLSSRFHQLKNGTFWLSETPTQASSSPDKSWHTRINRIATWAVLTELNSQVNFLILNTHFDHESQLARIESSRLISNFLQRENFPRQILLGDFNATPASTEFRMLAGEIDLYPFPNSPLKPAHTQSTLPAKMSSTGASITNFKEIYKLPHHIDHIFVTPIITVKDYEMIEKKENFNNGLYFPSDHIPVIADIFLN